MSDQYVSRNSDLVWGFELEFATKERLWGTKTWDTFASTFELKNQRPLNLQLGTDESVKTVELPNGNEFRTQLHWRVFPSTDIHAMLEFIKQVEGAITKTAGIHWTFSGITLSRKAADALKKIMTAVPSWKSRDEWVRKFSDKYYPFVARSDNGRNMRYETRVFNGSRDFRGIHQSWKFVDRQVELVRKADIIYHEAIGFYDQKLSERASAPWSGWASAALAYLKEWNAHNQTCGLITMDWAIEQVKISERNRA